MPFSPLRERIADRIEQAQEAVFLPREFRDFAGEDQVLRALRELVRAKRLVKLGYGVYGKAFVSSISGRAVLDSRGGFLEAARQALDKLGVIWEPSFWYVEYNAGRTTQVPANAVLRVKGRFSRKLGIGGMELRIER